MAPARFLAPLAALLASCRGQEAPCAVPVPANFHAARDRCEEIGGRLLEIRSGAVAAEVGRLLSVTEGHFWIGLRLPDRDCAGATAPLRGYVWTSGDQGTNFTRWKSRDTVCGSHCVSVSRDGTWAERQCHEHLDGFLCQGVEAHVCDSAATPDKKYSRLFVDPHGCLLGPCEHYCRVERAGYRCYCRNGYAISAQDERDCRLDCRDAECPALRAAGSVECGDGYVRDGHESCVDYNECDAGACEHRCFNTFGRYECACRDGFRPRGERCEPEAPVPPPRAPDTPPLRAPDTPPANSTAVRARAAAASPGAIAGATALVLLAALAVALGARRCARASSSYDLQLVGDEEEEEEGEGKIRIFTIS
ncbi:thrombomodulin-like [Denticeps clupeoides]|uniref:Thrombomodulin n=1 Tax=Denticeps clupeoides TaxID=299321 RepID=A0AAY4C7Y0_9TELE|nr:thrombomodulin-like [Denticeps clupeoides]